MWGRGRRADINPEDTHFVSSGEQTIRDSKVRQLGFGRSAVVDKLRLFSRRVYVRHC